MESRLTPENTAVILVDMQSLVLKEIYNKHSLSIMIANQQKVLQNCVEKNIPIVVLEYSSKVNHNKNRETTPQLMEIINQTSNYEVFLKQSHSGFSNKEFETHLENLEKEYHFLMGVNGGVCVSATGEGSIKRGYKIATSKDVIANIGSHASKVIANRKYTLTPIDEEETGWHKKNGIFLPSYKDFNVFSESEVTVATQ